TTMPSLHAALDGVGLARARAVVRQRQGGGYVQTPELRAVIDTGASDLFAAPGLLAHAGLVPSVRGGVTSAAGTALAFGYDVELAIVDAGDDSFWVPLLAGDNQIPFPGCDLILGISLLRRGQFLYDGRGGTFTLTWS